MEEAGREEIAQGLRQDWACRMPMSLAENENSRTESGCGEWSHEERLFQEYDFGGREWAVENRVRDAGKVDS